MTQQIQTQENRITELKKKWYSFVPVAMEIVKYAKNRETAFLNLSYNLKDRIRYLNLGAVDYFFKNLGIQTATEKANNEQPKNPYNFFSEQKNYSIYCSLAHIDWQNCPIKVFSYHGKTRKEQQEEFKEFNDKYFTDFDFAMDFDGDFDGYDDNKPRKLEITQEKAVYRSLRDLRKLLKFLENYKLQMWINFTGGRGFHLFSSVPLDISFNQKVDLVNILVKELAETLDLRTVDKTRYNSRKVFKCVYTLVSTKNGTFVCLPLSNEMISRFHMEDLEVKNVLKKIHLKNRGTLMRNSNLSTGEAQKEFMRLLSDLEIEIPEERDRRSF